MAGRINEEDVQSLRERANLAAVVSDYTALKRSGSRLKGLCPFHGEKTPSFFVDPARGFFHCFGCDTGGDVYDFLQRVEALTFPEAVERLARLEGVSLRYEELSPGQRRALGRRTRLVECLDEANGFYRAQLRTPAGEPAREYLGRRGFGPDILARFELGWAPDAWDATVRHLTGRGFSSQEIADAGLATRGQRGMTDRFRGRIMFPIYDSSGRDVVAFGGRVVPDLPLRSLGRDQTPPKYINSPETEVYRKSRTLYGLNWARAEIQRRDAAVVVEGYLDAIGLHQGGAPHVVATCGTALTAEHFQQLEKFARRVILALDADAAGYQAADRARAVALEQGVREVGVLPLPAGEDPADLAAHGPQRVAEALAATATAVEFQIAFLLQEADTSTPEGQVAAYRRTFPLLAQLDDRFLRYSYVRDIVAPAVRLSADLIEQELDRELGERTDAGPRRAPAPPSAESNLPRDPQLRLERAVLQAAIQFPDVPIDGWDDVSVDDFTADASQMLYTALSAAPWTTLPQLLQRLPDDRTRARIRALAVAPATTAPDPHKLAENVMRLRAATLSRRIAQIRTQLTRLNSQVDADQARALVLERQELERRRRALVEG
ncbi:MAG TPA: DNA primase [Euzebyales bacterium]|nr:DNA primase [Euzebyales bacterium]